MRATLLLPAIVACGSTSSGPPPTTVQPPVSAIAPRAGSDDIEVARVGGVQGWGACIVGQMRRGARSREAALDECVAFELMAQEAERRHVTSAPDVAEATRAAMVNRLIETEFEARYRTPADIGEFMTKLV